jgi:hypothetical protein
MQANQRFSYTGSSTYSLENVQLQNGGVALFDARTGIGGIDYMPADGDTVTVVAGYTTKTSNQTFQPGMNNNVYYLVSDTLYTSADARLILQQATPIPVVYVALSGGYYQGTFVFSNPNDFEYLYLIWDYSDNFNNGSISYYGDASERIIEAYFGANKGNAGVNYVVPDRPVRIQVKWNGVIVGDTGYVGLNSVANYNALVAAGVDAADIALSSPYNGLVNNGTGTIRFNKYLTDGDAVVYASVIRDTTSFFLEEVDPSLTGFYIDVDNGTLANVCSQVADTQYYHDGASALPTIGDRIYVDSGGFTLFDGGNAYHQTSTTLLVVPPVSGGTYVAIDSNGVVYEAGSCDCAEYAPPFIYQGDVYLSVGRPVNIKLLATGNPTSWSIYDPYCKDYSVTGGSNGTIYSYVSCDGQTKYIIFRFNRYSIISVHTFHYCWYRVIY